MFVDSPLSGRAVCAAILVFAAVMVPQASAMTVESNWLQDEWIHLGNTPGSKWVAYGGYNPLDTVWSGSFNIPAGQSVVSALFTSDAWEFDANLPINVNGIAVGSFGPRLTTDIVYISESLVVDAFQEGSNTISIPTGYLDWSYNPDHYDDIALRNVTLSIETTASAMPEPLTMGAVAVALCGLSGYIRNRRRAEQASPPDRS
jgi:hypothetical protein